MSDEPWQEVHKQQIDSSQTIRHEGGPAYHFMILPPFQGTAGIDASGNSIRTSYTMPPRVMKANVYTGEAWVMNDGQGGSSWRKVDEYVNLHGRSPQFPFSSDSSSPSEESP